MPLTRKPFHANDEFNRANSTNLGANWSEDVGDMAINNNRLSIVDAGSHFMRWTADIFDADQWSQCEIFDQGAGTFHGGVIVRMSGTTGANFYFLRGINSTNAILVMKRVDGSNTIIDEQTVTQIEGDVLRLEVSGSNLSGFINDVVATSGNDTALPTGSAGVLGLGGAVSEFDNWKAGNIQESRNKFVIGFF